MLVAAASHAGWNAAVKLGGDRLVVLGVINGVGACVAAVLVPWLPFPERDAWPYLIASVLIHSGYYYFLVQQYRVGDLSHVYPLARGLSPILVATGAYLVAGEALIGGAVVGLALACAGIISLAFEGGAPWRRDAAPVVYACATGVMIACYTVVDGLGVREAGHAVSYVFWLFLIDGIPVAGLAVVLRRRELGAILAREVRASLLGGTLQLVAYGLVVWAMSLGPMAEVSALRETSVIFASILGVVLLGERFGLRRVLASVVVAAGLILMHAF